MRVPQAATIDSPWILSTCTQCCSISLPAFYFSLSTVLIARRQRGSKKLILTAPTIEDITTYRSFWCLIPGQGISIDILYLDHDTSNFPLFRAENRPPYLQDSSISRTEISRCLLVLSLIEKILSNAIRQASDWFDAAVTGTRTTSRPRCRAVAGNYLRSHSGRMVNGASMAALLEERHVIAALPAGPIHMLTRCCASSRYAYSATSPRPCGKNFVFVLLF